MKVSWGSTVYTISTPLYKYIKSYEETYDRISKNSNGIYKTSSIVTWDKMLMRYDLRMCEDMNV